MKSIRSTRREFLKSTVAAGITGLIPIACDKTSAGEELYAQLDAVAGQEVLKKSLFSSPVIIESLELLRHENNYLIRVKTQDGAQGISVSNNSHMRYLYPLLKTKVMPNFIGKDARDLDSLIDGVYVNDSNYKLQGLALWICVASVEFAILDLLGRLVEKPIGALIGNIQTEQVSVYRANNYRGRSAQDSLKEMIRNVKMTGARAIKIKIGGRMSNDLDDPPGRTEELIPLVRQAFGGDMTLYADSNGSFSVNKAIETGRLLEKYQYDFYEEPVPFDWLEETKTVADNLDIPVAGGEQETSLHRFRWLIAHGAVQIVQPDLFYFGGMVRSMRVARMAQVAGKLCTPHISGSGLGYLYMLHFVSTLTNAGLYHEFKGINPDIPFACATSSLTSEEGVVAVPTGPGSGIELDPGFVAKHIIM